MCGSGGPSTTDRFDCFNVNVITQVASPKPDQVSQLIVGTVMDVRIVRMNERSVLAVLNRESESIVGGLVPSSANGIQNCIDEHGFEYEAEVISIDGGAVRVIVRNVINRAN